MQIIDSLKNLARRRVMLGIIVLGICVLVFILTRSCSGTGDMVYQYDTVSKGEVLKSISVTGTLDVVNSIMVLSKINGVVSQVLTDYNQRVGKYQLLATIDSSELDQQGMRVAAQLERARLDLEGAQMDLATRKRLFGENLISQKDLEQAELNFKKIQAALQQFQIEYDIVMSNKGNTTILSPTEGTVISVDIRPMDVVTVSKKLFVVAADLRKMSLTINVDESDIGKIQKGQKVTFTVSAYPNDTFEGKIDQVRFSPITVGGLVVYQAVVNCDNNDLKLKPGMTATAVVIVAQKKNVYRVANQAFVVNPAGSEGEPGKKYLWKKQGAAMEASPIKRVEVKPGLVGDSFTEIESGQLKEGDEVLIRMDKKLKVKDKI
ncbi:MAG: efflux RND transporter periplasmic adaptor subunit [Spirochaetes bacterium]|nr:MAG: efflux RND transporter periplasmic adaptor subunit [Spirochaetota bacterium]